MSKRAPPASKPSPAALPAAPPAARPAAPPAALPTPRALRAPAGEDALSGASIRVVANRTGIAADTLRMWERRYGFPLPSRRPGGSRVYSEEVIARLHLVARAIEAGFRPSEVVTLAPEELAKLVVAAEAEAPPRARAGARASASASAIAGASASMSMNAGAGSSAVEGVIEALRGEDVRGVRSLLRAAAVALGPRAFVTDLAHPLAVRVGELWAEGVLGVRHEHLASACLTSQLHLLLGALDDGDRSPAVLLATLPGEPHFLGVDMVAVYLASSLAAPRVLGADTPPQAIADAARALDVDAVGVSISPAAPGRATTLAVKSLLALMPKRVELWLGGAGARAIAPNAPSARLVDTWPALDSALAAIRGEL
jgi:DNA-binding transcriptional MerR regulator/methylmalonyl-CoA mutase cobalamin-binding subunit